MQYSFRKKLLLILVIMLMSVTSGFACAFLNKNYNSVNARLVPGIIEYEDDGGGSSSDPTSISASSTSDALKDAFKDGKINASVNLPAVPSVYSSMGWSISSYGGSSSSKTWYYNPDYNSGMPILRSFVTWTEYRLKVSYSSNSSSVMTFSKSLYLPSDLSSSAKDVTSTTFKIAGNLFTLSTFNTGFGIQSVSVSSSGSYKLITVTLNCATQKVKVIHGSAVVNRNNSLLALSRVGNKGYYAGETNYIVNNTGIAGGEYFVNNSVSYEGISNKNPSSVITNINGEDVEGHIWDCSKLTIGNTTQAFYYYINTKVNKCYGKFELVRYEYAVATSANSSYPASTEWKTLQSGTKIEDLTGIEGCKELWFRPVLEIRQFTVKITISGNVNSGAIDNYIEKETDSAKYTEVEYTVDWGSSLTQEYEEGWYTSYYIDGEYFNFYRHPAYDVENEIPTSTTLYANQIYTIHVTPKKYDLTFTYYVNNAMKTFTKQYTYGQSFDFDGIEPKNSDTGGLVFTRWTVGTSLIYLTASAEVHFNGSLINGNKYQVNGITAGSYGKVPSGVIVAEFDIPCAVYISNGGEDAELENQGIYHANKGEDSSFKTCSDCGLTNEIQIPSSSCRTLNLYSTKDNGVLCGSDYETYVKNYGSSAIYLLNYFCIDNSIYPNFCYSVYRYGYKISGWEIELKVTVAGVNSYRSYWSTNGTWTSSWTTVYISDLPTYKIGDWIDKANDKASEYGGVTAKMLTFTPVWEVVTYRIESESGTVLCTYDVNTGANFATPNGTKWYSETNQIGYIKFITNGATATNILGNSYYNVSGVQKGCAGDLVHTISYVPSDKSEYGVDKKIKNGSPIYAKSAKEYTFNIQDGDSYWKSGSEYLGVAYWDNNKGEVSYYSEKGVTVSANAIGAYAFIDNSYNNDKNDLKTKNDYQNLDAFQAYGKNIAGSDYYALYNSGYSLESWQIVLEVGTDCYYMSYNGVQWIYSRASSTTMNLGYVENISLKDLAAYFDDVLFGVKNNTVKCDIIPIWQEKTYTLNYTLSGSAGNYTSACEPTTFKVSQAVNPFANTINGVSVGWYVKAKSNASTWDKNWYPTFNFKLLEHNDTIEKGSDVMFRVSGLDEGSFGDVELGIVWAFRINTYKINLCDTEHLSVKNVCDYIVSSGGVETFKIYNSAGHAFKAELNGKYVDGYGDEHLYGYFKYGYELNAYRIYIKCGGTNYYLQNTSPLFATAPYNLSINNLSNFTASELCAEIDKFVFNNNCSVDGNNVYVEPVWKTQAETITVKIETTTYSQNVVYRTAYNFSTASTGWQFKNANGELLTLNIYKCGSENIAVSGIWDYELDYKYNTSGSSYSYNIAITPICRGNIYDVVIDNAGEGDYYSITNNQGVAYVDAEGGISRGGNVNCFNTKNLQLTTDSSLKLFDNMYNGGKKSTNGDFRGEDYRNLTKTDRIKYMATDSDANVAYAVYKVGYELKGWYVAFTVFTDRHPAGLTYKLNYAGSNWSNAGLDIIIGLDGLSGTNIGDILTFVNDDILSGITENISDMQLTLIPVWYDNPVEYKIYSAEALEVCVYTINEIKSFNNGYTWVIKDELNGCYNNINFVLGNKVTNILNDVYTIITNVVIGSVGNITSEDKVVYAKSSGEYGFTVANSEVGSYWESEQESGNKYQHLGVYAEGIGYDNYSISFHGINTSSTNYGFLTKSSDMATRSTINSIGTDCWETIASNKKYTVFNSGYNLLGWRVELNDSEDRIIGYLVYTDNNWQLTNDNTATTTDGLASTNFGAVAGYLDNLIFGEGVDSGVSCVLRPVWQVARYTINYTLAEDNGHYTTDGSETYSITNGATFKPISNGKPVRWYVKGESASVLNLRNKYKNLRFIMPEDVSCENLEFGSGYFFSSTGLDSGSFGDVEVGVLWAKVVNEYTVSIQMDNNWDVTGKSDSSHKGLWKSNDTVEFIVSAATTATGEDSEYYPYFEIYSSFGKAFKTLDDFISHNENCAIYRNNNGEYYYAIYNYGKEINGYKVYVIYNSTKYYFKAENESYKLTTTASTLTNISNNLMVDLCAVVDNSNFGSTVGVIYIEPQWGQFENIKLTCKDWGTDDSGYIVQFNKSYDLSNKRIANNSNANVMYYLPESSKAPQIDVARVWDYNGITYGTSGMSDAKYLLSLRPIYKDSVFTIKIENKGSTASYCDYSDLKNQGVYLVKAVGDGNTVLNSNGAMEYKQTTTFDVDLNAKINLFNGNNEIKSNGALKGVDYIMLEPNLRGDYLVISQDETIGYAVYKLGYKISGWKVKFTIYKSDNSDPIIKYLQYNDGWKIVDAEQTNLNNVITTNNDINSLVTVANQYRLNSAISYVNTMELTLTPVWDETPITYKIVSRDGTTLTGTGTGGYKITSAKTFPYYNKIGQRVNWVIADNPKYKNISFKSNKSIKNISGNNFAIITGVLAGSAGDITVDESPIYSQGLKEYNIKIYNEDVNSYWYSQDNDEKGKHLGVSPNDGGSFIYTYTLTRIEQNSDVNFVIESFADYDRYTITSAPSYETYPYVLINSGYNLTGWLITINIDGSVAYYVYYNTTKKEWTTTQTQNDAIIKIDTIKTQNINIGNVAGYFNEKVFGIDGKLSYQMMPTWEVKEYTVEYTLNLNKNLSGVIRDGKINYNVETGYTFDNVINGRPVTWFVEQGASGNYNSWDSTWHNPIKFNVASDARTITRDTNKLFASGGISSGSYGDLGKGVVWVRVANEYIINIENDSYWKGLSNVDLEHKGLYKSANEAFVVSSASSTTDTPNKGTTYFGIYNSTGKAYKTNSDFKNYQVDLCAKYIDDTGRTVYYAVYNYGKEISGYKIYIEYGKDRYYVQGDLNLSSGENIFTVENINVNSFINICGTLDDFLLGKSFEQLSDIYLVPVWSENKEVVLDCLYNGETKAFNDTITLDASYNLLNAPHTYDASEVLSHYKTSESSTIISIKGVWNYYGITEYTYDGTNYRLTIEPCFSEGDAYTILINNVGEDVTIGDVRYADSNNQGAVMVVATGNGVNVLNNGTISYGNQISFEATFNTHLNLFNNDNENKSRGALKGIDYKNLQPNLRNAYLAISSDESIGYAVYKLGYKIEGWKVQFTIKTSTRTQEYYLTYESGKWKESTTLVTNGACGEDVYNIIAYIRENVLTQGNITDAQMTLKLTPVWGNLFEYAINSADGTELCKYTITGGVSSFPGKDSSGRVVKDWVVAGNPEYKYVNFVSDNTVVKNLFGSEFSVITGVLAGSVGDITKDESPIYAYGISQQYDIEVKNKDVKSYWDLQSDIEKSKHLGIWSTNSHPTDYTYILNNVTKISTETFITNSFADYDRETISSVSGINSYAYVPINSGYILTGWLITINIGDSLAYYICYDTETDMWFVTPNEQNILVTTIKDRPLNIGKVAEYLDDIIFGIDDELTYQLIPTWEVKTYSIEYSFDLEDTSSSTGDSNKIYYNVENAKNFDSTLEGKPVSWFAKQGATGSYNSWVSTWHKPVKFNVPTNAQVIASDSGYKVFSTLGVLAGSYGNLSKGILLASINNDYVISIQNNSIWNGVNDDTHKGVYKSMPELQFVVSSSTTNISANNFYPRFDIYNSIGKAYKVNTDFSSNQELCATYVDRNQSTYYYAIYNYGKEISGYQIYIKYDNVISYVQQNLSLGGSAYTFTNLDANSIKTICSTLDDFMIGKNRNKLSDIVLVPQWRDAGEIRLKCYDDDMLIFESFVTLGGTYNLENEHDYGPEKLLSHYTTINAPVVIYPTGVWNYYNITEYEYINNEYILKIKPCFSDGNYYLIIIDNTGSDNTNTDYSNPNNQGTAIVVDPGGSGAIVYSQIQTFEATVNTEIDLFSSKYEANSKGALTGFDYQNLQPNLRNAYLAISSDGSVGYAVYKLGYKISGWKVKFTIKTSDETVDYYLKYQSGAWNSNETEPYSNTNIDVDVNTILRYVRNTIVKEYINIKEMNLTLVPVWNTTPVNYTIDSADGTRLCTYNIVNGATFPTQVGGQAVNWVIAGTPEYKNINFVSQNEIIKNLTGTDFTIITGVEQGSVGDITIDESPIYAQGLPKEYNIDVKNKDVKSYWDSQAGVDKSNHLGIWSNNPNQTDYYVYEIIGITHASTNYTFVTASYDTSARNGFTAAKATPVGSYKYALINSGYNLTGWLIKIDGVATAYIYYDLENGVWATTQTEQTTLVSTISAKSLTLGGVAEYLDYVVFGIKGELTYQMIPTWELKNYNMVYTSKLDENSQIVIDDTVTYNVRDGLTFKMSTGGKPVSWYVKQKGTNVVSGWDSGWYSPIKFKVTSDAKTITNQEGIKLFYSRGIYSGSYGDVEAGIVWARVSNEYAINIENNSNWKDLQTADITHKGVYKSSDVPFIVSNSTSTPNKAGVNASFYPYLEVYNSTGNAYKINNDFDNEKDKICAQYVDRNQNTHYYAIYNYGKEISGYKIYVTYSGETYFINSGWTLGTTEHTFTAGNLNANSIINICATLDDFLVGKDSNELSDIVIVPVWKSNNENVLLECEHNGSIIFTYTVTLDAEYDLTNAGKDKFSSQEMLSHYTTEKTPVLILINGVWNYYSVDSYDIAGYRYEDGKYKLTIIPYLTKNIYSIKIDNTGTGENGDIVNYSDLNNQGTALVVASGEGNTILNSSAISYSQIQAFEVMLDTNINLFSAINETASRGALKGTDYYYLKQEMRTSYLATSTDGTIGYAVYKLGYPIKGWNVKFTIYKSDNSEPVTIYLQYNNGWQIVNAEATSLNANITQLGIKELVAKANDIRQSYSLINKMELTIVPVWDNNPFEYTITSADGTQLCKYNIATANNFTTGCWLIKESNKTSYNNVKLSSNGTIYTNIANDKYAVITGVQVGSVGDISGNVIFAKERTGSYNVTIKNEDNNSYWYTINDEKENHLGIVVYGITAENHYKIKVNDVNKNSVNYNFFTQSKDTKTYNEFKNSDMVQIGGSAKYALVNSGYTISGYVLEIGGVADVYLYYDISQYVNSQIITGWKTAQSAQTTPISTINDLGLDIANIAAYLDTVSFGILNELTYTIYPVWTETEYSVVYSLRYDSDGRTILTDGSATYTITTGAEFKATSGERNVLWCVIAKDANSSSWNNDWYSPVKFNLTNTNAIQNSVGNKYYYSNGIKVGSYGNIAEGVLWAKYVNDYKLIIDNPNDWSGKEGDVNFKGVYKTVETDLTTSTLNGYPFYSSKGKAYYKLSDFQADALSHYNVTNSTYTNMVLCSGNGYDSNGDGVIDSSKICYSAYNYGYDIVEWRVYYDDGLGRYFYNITSGKFVKCDSIEDSPKITYEQALNLNTSIFANLMDTLFVGQDIRDIVLYLSPLWEETTINVSHTEGEAENQVVLSYNSDYNILNLVHDTAVAKTLAYYMVDGLDIKVAIKGKWNYYSIPTAKYVYYVDDNTYNIRVNPYYVTNIYKINLLNVGNLEFDAENCDYSLAGSSLYSENKYSYNSKILTGYEDYSSGFVEDYITNNLATYLINYQNILNGNNVTVSGIITSDILKKVYSSSVSFGNKNYWFYLYDGQSLGNVPVFNRPVSYLDYWETELYVYKTQLFNDDVNSIPANKVEPLNGIWYYTQSFAIDNQIINWNAHFYRKYYKLTAETFYQDESGKNNDFYGYVVFEIKDKELVDSDNKSGNYLAIYRNGQMNYYTIESYSNEFSLSSYINGNSIVINDRNLVKFNGNNVNYVPIYAGCELTVHLYDQSKNASAMSSSACNKMLGYKVKDTTITSDPQGLNLDPFVKNDTYTIYANEGDIESKNYLRATEFKFAVEFEKIIYDLTVELTLKGNKIVSGSAIIPGNFDITDDKGKRYTEGSYTTFIVPVTFKFVVDAPIVINYYAYAGFDFTDHPFTFKGADMSYAIIENQTLSFVADAYWLNDNYYLIYDNNYSVEETFLGELEINTKYIEFNIVARIYDTSNTTNTYLWQEDLLPTGTTWTLEDGKISLKKLFNTEREYNGNKIMYCYTPSNGGACYTVLESWALNPRSFDNKLNYYTVYAFPNTNDGSKELTITASDISAFISFVPLQIISDRTLCFAVDVREMFKITLQIEDDDNKFGEGFRTLTVSNTSNNAVYANEIYTYKGLENIAQLSYVTKYYQDSIFKLQTGATTLTLGDVASTSGDYTNKIKSFAVAGNSTLTAKLYTRGLQVAVSYLYVNQQGEEYSTNKIQEIINRVGEGNFSFSIVSKNSYYKIGDELILTYGVGGGYDVVIKVANLEISGNRYKIDTFTYNNSTKLANNDYEFNVLVKISAKIPGSLSVKLALDANMTENDNYGYVSLYVNGDKKFDVYKNQSLSTNAVGGDKVEIDIASINNAYELLSIIINGREIPLTHTGTKYLLTNNYNASSSSSYTVVLKKKAFKVEFTDCSEIKNYSLQGVVETTLNSGVYEIENCYVGKDVAIVRHESEKEKFVKYYIETSSQQIDLISSTSIVNDSIISSFVVDESMYQYVIGGKLKLKVESETRYNIKIMVEAGKDYIKDLDKSITNDGTVVPLVSHENYYITEYFDKGTILAYQFSTIIEGKYVITVTLNGNPLSKDLGTQSYVNTNFVINENEIFVVNVQKQVFNINLVEYVFTNYNNYSNDIVEKRTLNINNLVDSSAMYEEVVKLDFISNILKEQSTSAKLAQTLTAIEIVGNDFEQHYILLIQDSETKINIIKLYESTNDVFVSQDGGAYAVIYPQEEDIVESIPFDVDINILTSQLTLSSLKMMNNITINLLYTHYVTIKG